ncbi:hypothetical protein VP01_1956g1 [Puccinia sorghi]|uniref:Uncharacterized protein n=1 Tax=Puccinia sorghi TaxID=27349 RepID=A0A0L6VC00_9BASI|nr:hypothetical protein VP01_1956g1 [Puccinia sorghi]
MLTTSKCQLQLSPDCGLPSTSSTPRFRQSNESLASRCRGISLEARVAKEFSSFVFSSILHTQQVQTRASMGWGLTKQITPVNSPRFCVIMANNETRVVHKYSSWQMLDHINFRPRFFDHSWDECSLLWNHIIQTEMLSPFPVCILSLSTNNFSLALLAAGWFNSTRVELAVSKTRSNAALVSPIRSVVAIQGLQPIRCPSAQYISPESLIPEAVHLLAAELGLGLALLQSPLIFTIHTASYCHLLSCSSHFLLSISGVCSDLVTYLFNLFLSSLRHHPPIQTEIFLHTISDGKQVLHQKFIERHIPTITPVRLSSHVLLSHDNN